MQKKWCGFFFIVLISGFRPVFLAAEEEYSLGLEPLIITKAEGDIPLHSYAISSGELEESFFSSPLENLNFLPVDLQSRSPKGSIQTDFSLRGSTFQGVLMLIDGQRVNDPQTAHHNADIPLTKEDISLIEVLPGAGSSLFGCDAIGGLVNIITKKPRENKLILESSGGQYQTFSGLFSITHRFDNLGTRLSLENRESEGFREDTDFKKFTSAFSSSLDIPDGELNLDFGYLENEFGAYDFYTPGLGYLSKEWTKTYLLNTGLNLEKEGFIIKPNFLWRRHYDKFMLDKTLIRSRYLNHHRTDLYTPNIYFQKENSALGKIGLGLEYGQEDISSTNLGDHSREHKSIFMDDALDMGDNLSSGFSFRADHFDTFGEVFTGSLNLKYKLSKEEALRLGFSKSSRIPSFTELYYSDPTTLGNADLTAEDALNYQLGYDLKKESHSQGLTFFFRREKDFIDWIKRTPAQSKWQVENITEADVLGLESYFKINLTKNLKFDSNYTFINKHIYAGGYLYKYGPNYIKHLLNMLLSFNSSVGTESLGLSYKKKPNRRGWLLLDTHLSYKVKKNALVFLNVTNLLNVEYQEIEGIPQPKRWVEAGFRIEW